MDDLQNIHLRLQSLPLPAEALHIRQAAPAKALVQLADAAGMVKLALHPISVHLLRQEAAAYDAAGPVGYDRPRFTLLQDQGHWAAALLSWEHGQALSRWTSLNRRGGPYEQGACPVSLDSLLQPLPSARQTDHWCRRILRHWPGESALAAPAHGDFVHWNMLRRDSGQTLLLDYEYYHPHRSAGFDRCYWTLVPLLRRTAGKVLARWSMGILAARIGLCRRDMAIAITEHLSVLEQEAHITDFPRLSGQAAMIRRRFLQEAYSYALEQLLA
jgi:hypothetical protein